MHHGTYVMDEQGNPVLEPNLVKWCAWMASDDNRYVARHEIADRIVSTVFLGIAHGQSKHGKPLLYETGIFQHATAEITEQHETRTQAMRVHVEYMVAILLSMLEKAGVWFFYRIYVT